MLNAVVDLSHHNGPVDFAAARHEGILGVIHKASQGLAGHDPAYQRNREVAGAEGLLWGAYHFSTGGDGAGQAEHFVQTAAPDATTLLALDFEPNPSGPSMSLVEARAFVERIAELTGRYPGFYSGHYVAELLGDQIDPFLGRCWLWSARYGARPNVQRTWPTWTMWQYTDGHVGSEPHAVAGIGRCDRNKFNGNAGQLRRLWLGGEE